MHYDRAWRTGRLDRKTVAERFWEKVDLTGECWTWTAGTNAKGYGWFGINQRPFLAHRWAYEHMVGPIPEGLTLDHLCRVRHCVNPDHLEPVPKAVNNRRGGNSLKTHCPQGHEYIGENVIWRARGGRECRACVRESQRRRIRVAP